MRDNTMVTVSIDDLTPDPDRWSFSRPTAEARQALARSLSNFGQLGPLAALETRRGLPLVDGAVRLELLKKLGASHVSVLLLPEEGLWDSLLELRAAFGHRPNPVEIGLYLKKRMSATGETPADLAPKVFPALGLAPRPGAAEDPLWLAGLPEEDADRFASGLAPLTGVRVLAAAPRGDALAALIALRPFRLGANKFVETARWLLECAWRDSLTLPEWLARADLPDAESGGEQFRDAVWRLRYPKLASWSDSFKADAASLPLPASAALCHATNFEGGRLTLSLRFAKLPELAKAAAEVADSAETGLFDALEKYLD